MNMETYSKVLFKNDVIESTASDWIADKCLVQELILEDDGSQLYGFKYPKILTCE